MRDGIIGLRNAEVPSKSDAATTDVACCYICLDEPPKDPYQIPGCGHIFCFNCLRRWQSHAKKDPSLKYNPNNQASCPACRRTDTPDLEKSATENARLYATRASNADLEGREREEYRQKALAELDRVSDSQTPQTHAQVLITKGEILKDLGRYDEAIEAFQEILKLCEVGTEAKIEIEKLMPRLEKAMDEGREDEAEALMNQMEPLLDKKQYAGLEKDFMGTHLTIAEMKEDQEEWDAAIEIYKWKVMAAMEYDDTDTRPLNFTAVDQRRLYMGMSRCMYHKAEYQKAIELGLSAIEMNRHFPQVHKYVALSQKASGDMDAALRTMARAVHYETPWDDVNKTKCLEMYEAMKNDVGR